MSSSTVVDLVYSESLRRPRFARCTLGEGSRITLRSKLPKNALSIWFEKEPLFYTATGHLKRQAHGYCIYAYVDGIHSFSIMVDEGRCSSVGVSTCLKLGELVKAILAMRQCGLGTYGSGALDTLRDALSKRLRREPRLRAVFKKLRCLCDGR